MDKKGKNKQPPKENWTSEEVLKFYRNSQRFKIKGQDMEFFLGQLGILNAQTTLKQGIDKYCKDYNVPADIKKDMHVIRKNRNLDCHENIDRIEKYEVIRFDYQDSARIEQYRQYAQKKVQKPQFEFQSCLVQSTISEEGKVVKKKVCAKGRRCTDQDCKFDHPWGKKDFNTQCSKGLRCVKFQTGNCLYKHDMYPSGQEKQEDKKIKDTKKLIQDDKKVKFFNNKKKKQLQRNQKQQQQPQEQQLQRNQKQQQKPQEQQLQRNQKQQQQPQEQQQAQWRNQKQQQQQQQQPQEQQQQKQQAQWRNQKQEQNQPQQQEQKQVEQIKEEEKKEVEIYEEEEEFDDFEKEMALDEEEMELAMGRQLSKKEKQVLKGQAYPNLKCPFVEFGGNCPYIAHQKCDYGIH